MPTPPLFRLLPNRVWRTYLGGRTLDQWQGEPAPADSHFPEDWIASTTRANNIGREDHADEGLATVMHDGRRVTLLSLIEQLPEAMLGDAHLARHGRHVGFLAKFLDSSIRLHIQAHPTVPFARQHLNANHGKTEGYYIIATRPQVAEPYILFGFQRPPARAEYRRAILEQDEAALLAPFDKIPVRPGDAFVVPGGVPHAIGEGVFMIEIMEPTDFAVRLEFERGGYVLPEAARFMNRGVDFALDMLDFSAWPLDRIRRERFGQPRAVRQWGGDAAEESLIDARLTPYFQLRRLTLKPLADLARDSDAMHLGIVVAGGVTVTGDDGQAQTFALGQRFFVPAATRTLRYTAGGDGAQVVFAMAGD